VNQTLLTDDDRVLAFERRGSGPMLVCHPGGPGFSGAGYFANLADLHEQLTLVILDPRGTGASSRPAHPTAYRIEDYVADLDAVRAHLGVERMDLLGHSHGGVVAQTYAATYPDRIDRLILANTLSRFHDEQQRAMETAMQRFDDQPWYADAIDALEQEQAGNFASDAEMAALVAREMPFYFHALGPAARAWIDALGADAINADTLRFFNEEIFTSFDCRPLLSRITAPTLVISAASDFITGEACARDLLGAIPNATEAVIPDAGHFSYIEQPGAFRDAVLSFLAGH